MKIPIFFKSILIGIPVGVTFLDCVGYIARVEGIFFLNILLSLFKYLKQAHIFNFISFLSFFFFCVCLT